MSRKHKIVVPAPTQRSCGKNKYNSEREAEDVARAQELNDLTGQLRLRVYHCMFCGGWHLTKHLY